MRIYLTGRIAIEVAGIERLAERDLPGRQGRVALVCLVLERRRPLPREELADVVWPGDLPAAWDASLNALVSKLRGRLSALDTQPAARLDSAVGRYELRLPPSAWVDVEAAFDALHDAEVAVRHGRMAEAWGAANVTASIGGRDFLAGVEGAWVERQRARLRDAHVRALDCLAEIHAANGEVPLAIQAAEASVRLEPYRESAYRRLMRLHAGRGDRGEAIRAYATCRETLARDLGVEPSAETVALADAIGAPMRHS